MEIRGSWVRSRGGAKLKICIMFGCGCLPEGEGGGGGCTWYFVVFFFPFWKYVKYKTWCNSDGFVCVSLTNISHEQHWQISLCSFSNRMKTFTNRSHLKSFACALVLWCVCSPNRTLWQKFYSRMGLLYSRLMLIISNNCNVTKEIR